MRYLQYSVKVFQDKKILNKNDLIYDVLAEPTTYTVAAAPESEAKIFLPFRSQPPSTFFAVVPKGVLPAAARFPAA